MGIALLANGRSSLTQGDWNGRAQDFQVDSELSQL
jgi:hypothetical protein